MQAQIAVQAATLAMVGPQKRIVAPEPEMGHTFGPHPAFNGESSDVQDGSKFGNTKSRFRTGEPVHNGQG